MTSDKERPPAIPPYISFRTFKSFLTDLEEHGIPQRIDRSLLTGMSGTTQAWLLNSLDFLGLVNDQSEPTAKFHALLEADDEDSRRKIWRRLAEENYPEFFRDGLDLRRATADQAKEIFRQRGASGTTVNKCLGFFTSLCQEAAIELSPHLTRSRKGRRVSRSVRKKVARRAKAQDPIINDTSTKTAANLPALEHNLLAGLVEQLPRAGSVWAAEKRQAWFNLAQAIFQTTYKEEQAQDLDLSQEGE